MSELAAHGHEPHHEALQHHFTSLEQQREASSLGMWVFIGQEILFFGGLFATYTVYRHAYPEAFSAGSHHLSWKIGFFNTLVLIGSSLTMAMGVYSAADRQAQGGGVVHPGHDPARLGVPRRQVRRVRREDPALLRRRLARGLPGAGGALRRAGALHLEGAEAGHAQIFFSLYFAMTGLHALHMIIGVPILLAIAYWAWRGRYSPEYHTPVELVGLYWHFVDIVWIFLFPLLYLIGSH